MAETRARDTADVVADVPVLASGLSNRNLLYNGAMQVAQRGTSTASITGGGYRTADRWFFNIVSLGTWTQSIEEDGPTGSGLTKSLKLLCTTADAAPAAGDLCFLQQRLEGQDVQRIAKGTASAQQLTLSFWVKSNVTGTYILELNDIDNTRAVSASYTAAASGVWEYKTIVFPADTTGTFDNNNLGSLYLTMWLAAGSNFNSGTLSTTWQSTLSANRAVGQTNLAAATSNYWQITGVQLEVGPTATGFEFKSYGQELAECQRYYYQAASGTDITLGSGGYYNGSVFMAYHPFPVSMRVVPNLDATSGTNYYVVYTSNTTDTMNSLVLARPGLTGTQIGNSSEASGTQGYSGVVSTFNASARVAFSAEL